MNKATSELYKYLKNSVQAYTLISIGVFLFVLFFQPFLLESLDSNNKLIFIAGFGAIVFIIITLVDAATFLLRSKLENPEFINGFAMLALNSVAFAFYLRYVGQEAITFYIMFKVVFICVIPPVILKIINVKKELKEHNELLRIEKKELQKQLETYESENHQQTIDFVSENTSEYLSLMISEVVLIKSADNYIEIVYQEGTGTFKKKLLRNTLKNVEAQLKPFPTFVRCHRICIVNTLFVEKIQKDYSSHWITIKGYEENIPISRQYLLKLKEKL